jgi:flagellar hook assembly protein FlgD
MTLAKKMKNILAAIFLISSAALPLLAEEAKQSLIVEAPATWKVEFNGDKGMQVYTVVLREDGDTGLFRITRWPDEAGNVKQIPEQIEASAKNFLADAKDSKDFKVKTEKYQIEEITGDTFSGRFVMLEMDNGTIQTIFMIGDAEGVWSGVYSGTKERWAEVVSILKKLKKNG